jgi:predicted nicotinamide N-methyase
VYEGGLKLWECALDLVHYIAANLSLVRGKRVLELGCGQGLPGICSLVYGQAAQVMFQDYNEEVLEQATTKTVALNIPVV